MSESYTIGLDFGTNSVRAIVVDTRTGRELGSHIHQYDHGQTGVIYDDGDADLARQHPADYLRGIEVTVTGALAEAAAQGASPADVIGIGVDTTGSSPLPLDKDGVALGLKPEFADTPDALTWLWKDHTGHAEAEEITKAAEASHPEYLAKCGERYSSEWFWAKLLKLARVNPEVMAATHTWVEIADWIPAVLAGNTQPDRLRRGVCAAGHKAFYHTSWGGYADEAWLGTLHPELARVRRSLPDRVYSVAEEAGRLSGEWAAKLGLPEGIPIAIGAFDAHLGAVGAGVSDGTLVKIIGTSTCDIMVAPLGGDLKDVPGLCGIVPESVLPGFFGLEAGQSAVGDIYNWFVNVIEPGGPGKSDHAVLTEQALALKPGESGLVTLDWHNGNRTVLVDQRLTGLTVGMTLHTTPAEIYRSLLEASAFGARVIIERFEAYGVPVKRIINCGGISARNPLAMQIYADVLNRPFAVSPQLQTCALGSAIAAAVVAGPELGGHATFEGAVAAMVDTNRKTYTPIPENVAVYEKLYGIFKELHDSFGVRGVQQDLSHVMKDLLDLRDAV